MLDLQVMERKDGVSAEALREQGFVPAVLYGAKEQAAAIAINAKVLQHIWKEAGETTIITLKGAGADKDTLIRDVQIHPVNGSIVHADFYVLEKGKKIEIAVPLEFTGEAPAEKLGHVLVKSLHEVQIEVAPAELPQHLEVDLSKLENVGDHITAGDIVLPKSATLLIQPEDIIVSVTEFKEEKIEEPAAPTEGEAAAAEAAPSDSAAETPAAE